MNITSFAEVETVLRPYVRPVNEPGGYKLERIQSMMHFLGDPQDSYKSIHIAGTSGKTSTCYYVASMLHAAGFKVGHTVSPHVDSVAERAQINLQVLDEKTYCARLSEFLEIIEPAGIELSYFELLVAFAYWLFAQEKVDYAVIEVGLGGLLDGTNVISRPDKVCIITDIGYDHIEILGRTLSEIAFQKAGIIHAGNSVFIYEQNEEVVKVVSAKSQQVGADLSLINAAYHDEVATDLPLFQQRNWHLAYAAVAFTLGRDGRQILSSAQLEETVQTHVPGRMETIKLQDTTIIIDGAHNEQKISALVESVQAKYPGQACAMLVSFGDNKYSSVEASLALLARLGSSVTVTEFSSEQDQHRQAIPAERLAGYAQKAGFTSISKMKNPVEAFEAILQQPEKLLLITGSFYLFNHIHPALKRLGVM